MDFRKLVNSIGMLSFLGLAACTIRLDPQAGDLDDHIIGNPLSQMSALSSNDEGDSNSIVIFDKTVRRIHQFDIGEMKHIRTFGVRNPQLDHYVVHGQNGNYIIDMSKKGLSIFNKYDQANHQPIRFQGTPQSAAFLPSKGLFLIYDDMKTAGLLSLNANGEVLDKWEGGTDITGNATISAGDFTADGKLVFGLSNDSIVIVDPVQSMGLRDWVVTQTFATTLSDIKWVAPLPKNPQQVLVRDASKVALVDLNTGTILSSYSYGSRETVLKVSKFDDPHLIIGNTEMLKVVYAEASQVKVKTLYIRTMPYTFKSILNSNLNLTRDEWSFVESQESVANIFNDVDSVTKSRRFQRYNFSALRGTHEAEVANDTQVGLAHGFIFTLYPSELGYAVRFDLNTEARSELKLFNLKYIPAD